MKQTLLALREDSKATPMHEDSIGKASKCVWRLRIDLRSIFRLVNMKQMLHKKYLRLYYETTIFDQLVALCQGASSVKEYMKKYNDLTGKCHVHDD